MTKHIGIYKSFGEASRKEVQKTLEQPPVERIRETVGLILRVYGTTREELNLSPKTNVVNFSRNV